MTAGPCSPLLGALGSRTSRDSSEEALAGSAASGIFLWGHGLLWSAKTAQCKSWGNICVRPGLGAHEDAQAETKAGRLALHYLRWPLRVSEGELAEGTGNPPFHTSFLSRLPPNCGEGERRQWSHRFPYSFTQQRFTGHLPRAGVTVSRAHTMVNTTHRLQPHCHALPQLIAV